MTEGRYGWGKSHVVLRDREPKLKGNEISLRLLLEIPEAVFKRPKLEAKMTIPEQVIPKNLVTPDVQTNIEKIIKESTGLDIHVGLIEHEDKKDEQERE